MATIKKEYQKDGYIYRIEASGDKTAFIQVGRSSYDADRSKPQCSKELMIAEAATHGFTREPQYIGNGVLAVISDEELSKAHADAQAGAFADSMV